MRVEPKHDIEILQRILLLSELLLAGPRGGGREGGRGGTGRCFSIVKKFGLRLTEQGEPLSVSRQS